MGFVSGYDVFCKFKLKELIIIYFFVVFLLVWINLNRKCCIWSNLKCIKIFCYLIGVLIIE